MYMENKRKKFYQRNWFLWLWLLIFPPIGLVLLWTCYKEKKKKTKIILSIVFVIWFIILFSATSSDTEENTQNKEENVQNVEENTQNTPEILVNVSTDMFLKDVKSAIQDDIGEGESIKDVTIENGNLYVYVDISNVDPTPLTMEDLALSRASSITDAILELTQYDNEWNTITIDFNDLGYIKNSKENILDNGYGRYFPVEQFVLSKDN